MTDGDGTVLGADHLQDLVLKAVEGMIRYRIDDVQAAVRELVNEGSGMDCLAFVVGCMFCVRENLPARDGSVEILPGVSVHRASNPGRALFTEMLVDYLNGDVDRILSRFCMAEPGVAAAAIGAAIRAASDVIRSRRARLQ